MGVAGLESGTMLVHLHPGLRWACGSVSDVVVCREAGTDVGRVVSSVAEAVPLVYVAVAGSEWIRTEERGSPPEWLLVPRVVAAGLAEE